MNILAALWLLMSGDIALGHKKNQAISSDSDEYAPMRFQLFRG